MQCPHCNTPLEDDAVFCGNCGKQIAPMEAKGATVAARQIQPDNNELPTVHSRYGGSVLGSPPQQAHTYSTTPYTPVEDRGTLLLPRPPRGNIGRIALIAALVLLVVAGGTLGIVSLLRGNNAGNVSAANATGLVRFIDNQKGSPGHTDALHISIDNLAAPPAGFQYNAWLINEQNEQIVALGTLTANAQDHTFSLDHTTNGTNLLGLGNKLEITLEQGRVSSPAGKVILTGVFPPKAFVHIKHLLFSFPTTPGKIGLLVGLQIQAQLLNAQAQLLQSVAASHNTLAIQCVAQSMIDIIEGTRGSHYKSLPALCSLQNVSIVGDGFGLLGNGSESGYIIAASNHATLAASQSDTTSLIRVHAGHVVIAMTNMQGWVTTVRQDTLNLLAHPQNTSKVQEILTLADHAYHGVDTNGDEQIDPVPGEAGAITGYIHGQLAASLPLVPTS